MKIPAVFLLGLCACTAESSPPPVSLQTLHLTDDISLGFLPLVVQGKTIWMASTEISWNAYDLFFLRSEEDMAVDGITGPSKSVFPVTRGYGHDGMPALGMTLNAAESFCEWLSLRTGQTYRLPTVLEWEAALGDQVSVLTADADASTHAPHAVNHAPPNAQGFRDLLGNLAEWCHTADGKALACGGSFQDASREINPQRKQKYDISWQARDPQFPKSRWWMSDTGFVGFRIVTETPLTK